MAIAGSIGVVTGGNSGIGRAIALGLAEAGLDVAISARRADKLELVAEEIYSHGVRALSVPCDVSDPEQVTALEAQVSEHLGPCDILVNGAGVAESHKFIGHPDEIWHRALAVNLTGAYYVCKAFIPSMVEHQGGRVIQIASVASKTGASYIAAYTASKHGLLGLTRALAAELAPHRITVNAICPGYVDTPMTHQGISRMKERTGRAEAELLEILEQWSKCNSRYWILDSGYLTRDHPLAGRDACPTGICIRNSNSDFWFLTLCSMPYALCLIKSAIVTTRITSTVPHKVQCLHFH